MKKKILLTTVILIAIIIAVLLILGKEKQVDESYIIRVELVDSKSPDRKLKVLKGNKEIEYLEIRYLDDTFLCSSKNPTVYFGDIEAEKEMVVILIDKTKVTAKIIKGDK
jgi:hypothetical protein